MRTFHTELKNKTKKQTKNIYVSYKLRGKSVASRRICVSCLKKYQQTSEMISTRKTSHEQSPESPTASLKDVTQIPDLSQQRLESLTVSLKDVTQTQQQRPESPTVTLTRHASTRCELPVSHLRLCCCACVTSFECELTPLLILHLCPSALTASFLFR